MTNYLPILKIILKHMRRYSISFMRRIIQSKTTPEYHFSCARLTKILKNILKMILGKAVSKQVPPCIAGQCAN